MFSEYCLLCNEHLVLQVDNCAESFSQKDGYSKEIDCECHCPTGEFGMYFSNGILKSFNFIFIDGNYRGEFNISRDFMGSLCIESNYNYYPKSATELIWINRFLNSENWNREIMKKIIGLSVFK